MESLHKVCIIGAGNVASHMAINLHKAGFLINGIFSRNIMNAQYLAEQTECAYATNRISKLPVSDAYIFSVKDSILEKLVDDLSKTGIATNAIVIHTAGSVPLSLLSQRFTKSAVIYPMQTISKDRNLNFQEVPLFIEASNISVQKKIEGLCRTLSNHVTVLSSEQRRKLHLSAVFACNFVNHCYALAFKLLSDASISPTFLLPLIDETAKKVHCMSPTDAQTGPAVRWDENVIAQQIESLSDSPEMQEVYKIMSQSIHKLADNQ